MGNQINLDAKIIPEARLIGTEPPIAEMSLGPVKCSAIRGTASIVLKKRMKEAANWHGAIVYAPSECQESGWSLAQ